MRSAPHRMDSGSRLLHHRSDRSAVGPARCPRSSAAHARRRRRKRPSRRVSGVAPPSTSSRRRTIPRKLQLEAGRVTMAVAREAEPVGSLHEIREAGLDREDLLGMYRNMLLTRGIEERGHILYKQGKIPGSFYTGRGNEASSVGVATAMVPEDVGCALAFRIRNERRVAVSWYGEGASARGDAHEGMNFAGVRRLPVVFICDNNQWAYSTPTHLEYACETLAD